MIKTSLINGFLFSTSEEVLVSPFHLEPMRWIQGTEAAACCSAARVGKKTTLSFGKEKQKRFHVNTTQCESLSLRGIV